MSSGMTLWMCVLAVAVVVSALLVAESKHNTRVLFQEVEQLRDERDALNVEWSRLRLEQGALSTHSRVEAIARDELGLRRPDAGEIVLIQLNQNVSAGAVNE